MALNTFSPVPLPSPGTSTSIEAKVKVASFGDGYTQTTRDGLNSLRRVVTVRWEVLTETQADTIETFIVGQGEDIPFFFTNRGDIQRKWTFDMKSFRRVHGTPNTIEVTLRESFSLLS